MAEPETCMAHGTTCPAESRQRCPSCCPGLDPISHNAIACSCKFAAATIKMKIIFGGAISINGGEKCRINQKHQKSKNGGGKGLAELAISTMYTSFSFFFSFIFSKLRSHSFRFRGHWYWFPHNLPARDKDLLLLKN